MADPSSWMRHDERETGDRLPSRRDRDVQAAQPVPVSALLPADSPRLGGEDAAHVRLLAELSDALPPILVHRQTMRVIDGMHRLRAAQLRGDDTVDVQFFSGAEDLAFVLAVEANIAHGLPLSSSDRQAAAARILASFPEWSDRAIARFAGLSGKTVKTIRGRTAEPARQPAARVGEDGRLRPVSSVPGRLLASEVLAVRPDASLREVAKIAGISPGTVRDVRQRLLRGEGPIPEGQRGRTPGDQDDTGENVARRRRMNSEDRVSTLRNLKKDPSLRFSDSGRALLRWLDGHPTGPQHLDSIVDAVPQHCADLVADLARECAADWHRFADELERTASAQQPDESGEEGGAVSRSSLEMADAQPAELRERVSGD